MYHCDTYLIPYFDRRSLDNGAVINFLLMCDGAVKCRFLCFLDEADTFLFNFMVNQVLDTTLKSKSQSQFGVVCATSLEVATVYHFLQDSANRDGEPFLLKNGSGTTGWQKFVRTRQNSGNSFSDHLSLFLLLLSFTFLTSTHYGP